MQAEEQEGAQEIDHEAGKRKMTRLTPTMKQEMMMTMMTTMTKMTMTMTMTTMTMMTMMTVQQRAEGTAVGSVRALFSVWIEGAIASRQ